MGTSIKKRWKQLTLIKHFTFNTLHSEEDKFPQGVPISWAGAAYASTASAPPLPPPPSFRGVSVGQSSFYYALFRLSLFVFFFSPPLSCFELWLLIILIWHLQTSFDIILIFDLFNLLRGNVNCMLKDTVKPVLRDQVRNKEKWPYKRDDLLNEVQFKWNCLWQDRKMWPVSACDCSIEVIAWTGLTVIFYSYKQNI